MRLEVSCEDRLGLTRELLDRLVEHNIDLRGIEIDTSGIIYLNFPELEFRDFQHLMPEIRRIPGVYDVKTIPYMPSEREHHEIEALLKALPDLVFSLDSKGKVTQANQSALTTLGLPVEEVRGVALGSLVKGFSFARWLEASEIKPQTCKLSFNGEEYLADLMPLFVAEEKGRQALAGAVVVLKSARRVGMHFSALHAVEVGGFEHLQAESQKMKQVLVEASTPGAEILPHLTTGASAAITGNLVASPAKGQKWELRAASIQMLGAADATRAVYMGVALAGEVAAALWQVLDDPRMLPPLGLGGLLIFLLLWSRWYQMGARFLWPRSTDLRRRLGVGILFCITGTFLQSITEWVFYQNQIFTTLMGAFVPPRKKFIQSHAKLANLDV
jgi:hypothetical protein